jgi:hypothetical protein
MQRLGDLFSIILNVVFVFATVSYVASSIGEGVSEIQRWRAKFLLNSIEALLDDLQFKGPARELYNNMLFNPLGDGALRSKADVSDYSALPTDVDPLVFGQAMLEVLGFEEAARAELAVSQPNLDNFVTSAKACLAARHDRLALSDRLHDLALNMLLRNENAVKATPGLTPTQQITNLLIAMIKEMGNWFSFGQVLTSTKYKSRMRGVNFAVGFGLAAVLDLQPVPTGGSALAGKFPYGVAVFEWLMVAASTLLGGPFWFEILKKIGPGIVGAQKGAPPTSGLAGEALVQEQRPGTTGREA